MTNRKRFIINGILLTAVGLAVRSVALLFNSYISKILGEEGMGLFTIIGTVYAFAVTLATSGVSLTVTRLASDKVGRGEGREALGIVYSAMLYATLFSTAAAISLFLLSPYLSASVLHDLRAIRPLRCLALSLVPLSVTSVLQGYFVGVKRVGKNALVQVAGQLFRIFITVILLLRSARLGVEAGTVALCVGITLTEIASCLLLSLEFLIDKARNFNGKGARKSHIGAVCKMALPLAVSQYVRSALLTLEHVLIPKRLRDGGSTHKGALSSYGALHGMALPILLFPLAPLSSFSGLLVPEFSESLAKNEKSRMEKMATEALEKTLAYSMATMSFLILFSEQIALTLYSSQSAGYYVALIAPVLPVMYLDHVTDAMLKGIGEHVYSMWVNITDSLLSVILVWVLIARMGIAGYAVVIVVMEGYNFTLSYLRLRKRITLKISIVKSVLFPLLAATLASLVTKHLFSLSTTSPLWLSLEILFATSAFVGIYTLLPKPSHH